MAVLAAARTRTARIAQRTGRTSTSVVPRSSKNQPGLERGRAIFMPAPVGTGQGARNRLFAHAYGISGTHSRSAKGCGVPCTRLLQQICGPELCYPAPKHCSGCSRLRNSKQNRGNQQGCCRRVRKQKLLKSTAVVPEQHENRPFSGAYPKHMGHDPIDMTPHSGCALTYSKVELG